jgi:[acyl-carrier-protein] S-malonyltransferase
MSHKIALLFAGQGAQAVGMGKDFAAEYPVAANLFRRADEILGFPLSRIAFEGPVDELTKTSICQPALYVHGLAGLAALQERSPASALARRQASRSGNLRPTPRREPSTSKPASAW